MRRLLFSLTLSVLTGFFLITCSGSGGGGATGDDTQMYDVSVSMAPSDGGSVSPSDTTVEGGTDLSMKAEPIDEYLFTHWTGDVDSTSENPITITVDQDYSLTANFEIKSYELTINTDGEGRVDEEIVQQKSTDYDHGTVVELTANPAEGYEFAKWQGDVTGTDNPAQITVDDPKEVTAVFEKATYKLTANTSGEGSVSISPDQSEYEFGTEVELTAEPSTDWEFDQWDGDTTGTDNPITVRMDSSITVTAVFVSTVFAGGSGTKEYPFKISTLEQLQSIYDYSYKHYVLINDIDATSTSTWNNGKGFKPLGDDKVKFTGSFDGQNYKISNLFISRTGTRIIPSGLFGKLENASITNLEIENAEIKGESYLGILAGYSQGGTISNISVSGTLNGESVVGGMFGNLIETELKNCSSSIKITNYGFDRIHNIGGLSGTIGKSVVNDCNVNGSIIQSNYDNNSLDDYVGGVAGSISGSEINNSHTNIDIDSYAQYVGGFIGKNYTSTIKKSSSEGKVTGFRSVGGFVGQNEGIITESYSNTEVSNSLKTRKSLSSSNIGGFAGANTSWKTGNPGQILKSYSKGTVEGHRWVGGFSAGNCGDCIIKRSYSTANVTGNENVGGFLGSNNGTAKFSYANGDVNGQVTVGGFSGENRGAIESSYAKGDVKGDEEIGGFIGYYNPQTGYYSIQGKVNNSFATGTVIGKTDTGGLIGVSSDTVSGVYWDIESTSQENSLGRGNPEGTIGLSTSEMTGTAAETNMPSLDWSEIWVITDSYPALFWE